MIPFAKPSVNEDDMRAVTEVWKSGWLTTGAVTEKFECEVASYCGAKHAIATSSGTMALQIALEAAGIMEGDEVITTPFTFTATAEAIVRVGATPVFADVVKGGVLLDPERVAAAVNSRTRAIVPVGIGGTQCDIKGLSAISRKFNIPIIEDGAHTFGLRHTDYIKATVFSFHANKNLTTNGEGGMVVTNSDWMAEKIRVLTRHGMTSSSWMRSDYVYDISQIGYKANMPDTSAAMGLSQLERFEKTQGHRRYLIHGYRGLLQEVPVEYRPVPVPSGVETSACHLFQVFIPDGIDRDRVYRRMSDLGVQCGVHYIPLYRMTAYTEKISTGPTYFPNCEHAYKRILSLPLFASMTWDQLEGVCEHLVRTLREEHEANRQQKAA